jgi:Nucleotide-diphospho-sugar transferase
MNFDVPADRFINGNIAFFTFATNGFAPFVLNLHASMKRFDPPLADKLIVFCADEEGATRLRSAGLSTVLCDPAGLPESVGFAHEGFGRVMSYKYALARSLLRQAEYAWWCDCDIVIRGPVSERIPALLADSDADLLMQEDVDEVSMGFWIARRSPTVDEMLTDLAETTDRDDIDDQGYFNEHHARAGALSIATLDPDEFMCGERFYYRRLCAQPQGLVLHFNHSVGAEVKRRLMMEHHAWYLPHTRTAALRARMGYLIVAVDQHLRV